MHTHTQVRGGEGEERERGRKRQREREKGYFVHYMPVNYLYAGDHGSQKRLLDTLELELQTVFGCHVGAGNQIQSSARTVNALNC